MSEPRTAGGKMAEEAWESFRSFDYEARTRVVFGRGCVERCGELARQAGIHRALVVSDPGIAAAGHLARVRSSLESAGVETESFEKVRENPTTEDVEHCLEAARRAPVDGIIGLGGGSSLDTAKGCNFLLTNGGRMEDYWGVGKATRPMLPMIAIPTTAGTGSECQSFALIAEAKSHHKMACGDPKAAARVALLDPELTLSQPARVTAWTGIDALSHALETAVTLRRSPLSVAYSRQAFELCSKNLPRVLQKPDDLDARSGMQLGAALGGMAIENSMLGAAHAAANPLTTHYGIVHGQAVGIMLAGVVRFNAQEPAIRRLYSGLVCHGPPATESDVDVAMEHLLATLQSLLALAGMPRSLAQCQVSCSSIPTLAAEAAKQWTAAFNPRKVSEPDFVQLYQAAFEGLPAL